MFTLSFLLIDKKTMKMCQAYELQANFIAGLQIIGESEGELEWMGDNTQWNRAEYIKEDMLFEPFKDYNKYQTKGCEVITK